MQVLCIQAWDLHSQQSYRASSPYIQQPGWLWGGSGDTKVAVGALGWQWGHRGGSGGTGVALGALCGRAVARARPGAAGVSGSRCQPAARAGQEGAELWLPAPLRWSPASPGCRIVVFLLWHQPRGSSLGMVALGALPGEALSWRHDKNN